MNYDNLLTCLKFDFYRSKYLERKLNKIRVLERKIYIYVCNMKIVTN